MRVLLGTCLAVVLAATTPAIAGPNGDGSPRQLGAHTGAQADTDMNGQDQDRYQDQAQDQNQDQAAPRHRHGGHHGLRARRQFVEGDHLRPKLLTESHLVRHLARWGLDRPLNGDRWIKAHHQFLLVSADGVVKQAMPRPARHHRYREQMQHDGQQDGPQVDQPYDSQADQGDDGQSDQQDDSQDQSQ